MNVLRQMRLPSLFAVGGLLIMAACSTSPSSPNKVEEPKDEPDSDPGQSLIVPSPEHPDQLPDSYYALTDGVLA